MLITVIIACEVGFWVLLASGLGARYLLRLPRVGAALLLAVPLVDLVLLAATILHLRSGATAEFAHGLAAAYLGFTVAFGHRTIRWADAQVAHRFAGGARPPRPPRGGRARVEHEWRVWLRTLVGCAVAAALLQAGIWLVDDPVRTAELAEWFPRLVAVLAIAALVPLGFLLRPGGAERI